MQAMGKKEGILGLASAGIGVALIVQLVMDESSASHLLPLTLLAACCLILMPLVHGRTVKTLLRNDDGGIDEGVDGGVDKSYREYFEEVAVGLLHVDLEGRFVRVNRATCEFLGFTEQELLQTTFQSISLPEELPASIAFIKASLAGEIDHNFSLVKRYRHKQGHLTWAKLTTTLVRDEQGKPHYFFSSIQDVAELKQAEARLDESLLKLKEAYLELEQISRRDGLTGALNITTLRECAQDAFQRFARYGTPSTLVFIDLDRFKEVNDTHGHMTGDRALIALVKKLQLEVRQTDAVGRYGGDEFVVLLTNSDGDQAKEYCHRLGTSITLPFDSRPAVEIGISVGIYQLSPKVESVEQWFELADREMYLNKKT